jgi:hypothetical protein
LIDGVSTVREFIDLLDKQQQEEIRRLIEKLTADTSIDSISTGRRPIDGSSSKICRIIGRIIRQHQQEIQQQQ